MAPTLRTRREKEGFLPPPPLRQSPRQPCPATVKEPPHSNQVISRSAAICRTNPRISRSCKRGILTNIDSLPDELLFDILLRLPAEEIHENARFVCRRWKCLIDDEAFVQAHLHLTGYGLVISTWINDPPTSFMAATRDGGIEVSKLNSKSESMVKASCNGLILATKDYCTLHVVNPATKGCFKLPEFRREGRMLSLGRIGIAYAAASMKYKVVAINRPLCSLTNPKSVQCIVKTVGVDNTWRHVATQQLSPKAHELLNGDLLTAEGFMHWSFSFRNTVLTLNVESEVLAESCVPLSPLSYRTIRGRRKYHYLSTGRHLSVLISCGDLLWEVWEMKGGSGEWRKVMPNIDMNARKSEIRQLVSRDVVRLEPVGWVNYPEVLLFFPKITSNCDDDDKANDLCIIYNLDSDEIKSIKLPEPVHRCEALVHKNSLVCLS